MELSDSKTLEAVLRDWEQRIHRKKPARVSAAVESRQTTDQTSERKARPRRCQCGACPRCEETARWEKIFQAKFADPEYYKRRRVSHVSPLSEN